MYQEMGIKIFLLKYIEVKCWDWWIVGAGRTEFAELMFGMRQKTAGKFIFKGKENFT